MRTLLQDLQFSFRLLSKNPAFTAVAVLTLALGIGANTIMFSVINAILVRPLPYQEANRLVLIWEKSKAMDFMMVSYPNFLDWQKQNQVFESAAVFNRYRSMNLTGTGEPERLSAAYVSADFFRVLRVQPALGRVFAAEEDRWGGPRVVIVSHGLWQRRFGADPGLVGRALTLDGKSYSVLGILPSGFDYPQDMDIWAPLGQFADAGWMERSNHNGLLGIARLKPGVGVARAGADMEALYRRLEGQYPASNSGLGATVQSMHEAHFGYLRTTLLVLLAAVGCVLLVACVNVANLLLARATGRQKEIAVRAAMGARRGHLIRQLLTENVFLSLLGGVLGLVLANGGTELLQRFAADQVPRATEIRMDASVLGFTLGVTLLTALIFGLAPALLTSRVDLHETLKETRSSPSRRPHLLRGGLVVAEVALSLTLLIGAGLLGRSFLRLVRVNPGFNPQSVLTVRISLPKTKYPQDESVAPFYRRALEGIRALPGVQSVAVTRPLPFSNEGWEIGMRVAGQTPPASHEKPLVDLVTISPDYFQTMQIPFLRGRTFTERDSAGAPRVAIINQTAARRFFPREDPLGRKIQLGGDTEPWTTIIGVVGDVRLFGLTSTPPSTCYLSSWQASSQAMTFVVRTASDPLSLAPAVRKAVLEVDADQPVFGVNTLEHLVDSSITRDRFAVWLLCTFALLACLLASVGIYGVISYAVSQRTHEIGIRIALGAEPRAVMRRVVRQGMVLALLGVACGLAAAFALTRFLASLLYGVPPRDFLTFASVSAVLAAVAFLACYLPARRASRVDPMVALRCE